MNNYSEKITTSSKTMWDIKNISKIVMEKIKESSRSKPPTSSLEPRTLTHRGIALFFVLIFLQTLIPYNQLRANNNGPNAPEAASFEPVDATDMVNLLTGDMSYVLPLMNVPSPEGGYPIALAYHAGIAMDQEASWTGLGWNLNPGAINRSVNGYPDDYDHAEISNFFYDDGNEESYYSLSVGYSAFGGTSVGVGLSWGSNQSVGGYVSVGFGLSEAVGVSARIGSNGVGIGANFGIEGSGLTFGLGVSVGQGGGISGSANVGFDKNGAGFNIGGSTDGTYSASISKRSNNGGAGLGVSFSSDGVGISLSASMKDNRAGSKTNGKTASRGIGIGLNSFVSTTISEGAYSVSRSSSVIPLMVPTPIGIFSLSFGKQKITYRATDLDLNLVSGPLKFNSSLRSGKKILIKCFKAYSLGRRVRYEHVFSDYLNDINEFDEVEALFKEECVANKCGYCETVEVKVAPFMDVYEIPLTDNTDFASEYRTDYNNPVFPSYDSFNVQGQGLSGSIHAKLIDNGALVGVEQGQGQDGFKYTYGFSGVDGDLPDYAKFKSKPYFYFDNEISTYLASGSTSFESIADSMAKDKISEIFRSKGSASLALNKQNKSATYVRYVLNSDLELSNGYAVQDILKPNCSGFNINNTSLKGIGAYQITAADGKTYHYSLPVYNHEIISRTYGVSSVNPGASEKVSYFEKRMLEPYATHWLLTAVTGPDFVDNGDQIAGEGDLGYWVSFEYGMWSDAYIWQNPYGKDFVQDKGNPKIKSWTKGRKQLVYLDKIKTRTHTALFVKSERNDNLSSEWNYASVNHVNGKLQRQSDYVRRFSVPRQKPLQLDKIILVTNDHDSLNKKYDGSEPKTTKFGFPNTYKSDLEIAFDIKENVIDISDNWKEIIPNAIKVIDFNYRSYWNGLAKGTPNTTNDGFGRLTLSSINFKGKSGKNVIPPYRFDYINPDYTFSIDDQNVYGYYSFDPSIWSLNEITTPQGGKIKIDYEQHSFKAAHLHDIVIHKEEFNRILEFNSETPYNLSVGDEVDLRVSFNDNIVYSGGGPSSWTNFEAVTYEGKVRVVDILRLSDSNKGNYKISLKFLGNSSFSIQPQELFGTRKLDNLNEDSFFKMSFNTGDLINSNQFESTGGIRVKSIATTDGVNTYKSRYKYGENNDGIGWVSYIPYATDAQVEVPYSTELPAPKVMYEYVSVESLDNNAEVVGSIDYNFNVMKSKDSDKLKYGDFYEIDVTRNDKTSRDKEYEGYFYGNNIYDVTEKKNVTISQYSIYDNLNAIGQLLSVSTYNSENQKLNELTNTYFSPEELMANMGVVKESYQSYKLKTKFEETKRVSENLLVLANHYVNWLVNSSQRIKYPSLLKTSTEKTNGMTFTTTFRDFDLVSGQAKETYTSSSTGLELKTVSEPAFYKYPEMGSKIDDKINKNMLSQGAKTFTYIKTPTDTNWELIEADIQTWNSYSYDYEGLTGYDQVYGDYPFRGRVLIGYRAVFGSIEKNVWRKHKNYFWKGKVDSDGVYVDFVDFNWSPNETQNSNWQKISEITKYNEFSKPLEILDINGNKASTKMGDKDTKVFAVCNAGYNEMFYNGAEGDNYGYNSGGVFYLRDNAGPIGVVSHTGKISVSVRPEKKGFTVEKVGVSGDYKISVWVDNRNDVELYKSVALEFETPSGAKRISYHPEEVVFAGDWVQLNFYANLQTTYKNIGILNTSLSKDISHDDFRMHPVASSMVSYVYNEWDELTYVLGANNLATKYEYDAAGRLKKTFVETIDTPEIKGGFKMINQLDYHYKNK